MTSIQDAYNSWQKMCSSSSPILVHLGGKVNEICSTHISPPGGFLNIPGEIGWNILNGIATLIGDIGYIAMSLLGHDVTVALLTSGSYLGLLGLAREISIAVAIGAFFAVLIRAMLRSIAGNPIAGRELAQGLLITLAAVALTTSGIIYEVGLYVVSSGPTIAGLIWSAGLHNILAGLQLSNVGGVALGTLLGAFILWILNFFFGLSVIFTLLLAPIGILLGLYVTVALGALVTSLFGVVILPIGMALAAFRQGKRWFAVALELVVGGVVAQSLSVLVVLFAISLLLVPISQTSSNHLSNAWFTFLAMVFDIVFLVFATRILRHVISLASRVHDSIATHYNGFSNTSSGINQQQIRPTKEDLATPEGVVGTLAASAHKIDRALAGRLAGTSAKLGAGAQLASATTAGALGAALSTKALKGQDAKAQLAAGAGSGDEDKEKDEAEATSDNEQQLDQAMVADAATKDQATADTQTSADTSDNAETAEQGAAQAAAEAQAANEAAGAVAAASAANANEQSSTDTKKLTTLSGVIAGKIGEDVNVAARKLVPSLVAARTAYRATAGIEKPQIESEADKNRDKKPKEYGVVSRMSAAAAVAMTHNRVKALQHQAALRERLGLDRNSLIQQALAKQPQQQPNAKGQGPSTPPPGPAVPRAEAVTTQGPTVASTPPAPTTHEAPAVEPRKPLPVQEPPEQEPPEQGPAGYDPDNYDRLFTTLDDVPPSDSRESSPEQWPDGHGDDGGEDEGHGLSQ